MTAGKLLLRLAVRCLSSQPMFVTNQPRPRMLTNVQFSENRPSLTESSVWKSTKRYDSDDVIVDGAMVQNLPIDGDLSL